MSNGHIKRFSTSLHVRERQIKTTVKYHLTPVRISLFSYSVLAIPRIANSSLSFTISWNLLKLMSIESMMPSNHLILCHLLLLLPLVFPSIRVFSNKSNQKYSEISSHTCQNFIAQLLSYLRSQGLQILPCPSPSSGICSNSCPLSQ